MGHKLAFTNTSANMNPNETFYCSMCMKPSYTASGRWGCNACNYFICTNCKRAPYKSTTDYAGHQLLWTNMPAYDISSSTGTFTCQNCGVPYSTSTYRWNCAMCSFNICSNCRKQPYMSTTCPSGHALAWNTTPYPNSNGTYACNQCGSIQNAMNGRWFCQDCQFDICPSCKQGGPPLAPIGMPSQPVPPPMPAPNAYNPPVYGTPVYSQPQPQVTYRPNYYPGTTYSIAYFSKRMNKMH